MKMIARKFYIDKIKAIPIAIIDWEYKKKSGVLYLRE